MTSKASDTPLVLIDDMTISFDGFTAVDGISLEVKPGEVVGILGSNGAGKSSTMKVIGGVIKHREGTVEVGGFNLSNALQAEAAKGVVGYCPDVGGLITGATPREHIQLLLSLHNKPQLFALGLKLVEVFGLQENLDSPVGGFSHGQSRRLSVLLATLSAEKVLVLDEPFDGVDPQGVASINQVIAEAKASGLAIVVSTHLLSLLADVSDRVVVMKKGKVIHRAPSYWFRGKLGARRYKKLLDTK